MFVSRHFYASTFINKLPIFFYHEKFKCQLKISHHILILLIVSSLKHRNKCHFLWCDICCQVQTLLKLTSEMEVTKHGPTHLSTSKQRHSCFPLVLKITANNRTRMSGAERVLPVPGMANEAQPLHCKTSLPN